MRAAGGKLDDNAALVKGMETAGFESVRGSFKFNTNHFPIQNFYLFRLAKQARGDVLSPETVKLISPMHGDSYAASCTMK